jgi:hypothetical protein
VTPDPNQFGQIFVNTSPPPQHDETVSITHFDTTYISPRNGHPPPQGVYGTGHVAGDAVQHPDGADEVEEEEEEERSGLKLGLGDFVFVCFSQLIPSTLFW